MKNNKTVEAMTALRKLEELLAAYDHALGVVYYDAATIAPKGSYEGRGKTMGILSGVTYELITKSENAELLMTLESDLDSLNEQERREVRRFRKRYDEILRIPAEEYVEYSVLTSDASVVWEEAKNKNDFSLFAPYLEKIVEFNKKFAGYYHPEMKPYDSLLDQYEKGLTMETLDSFFMKLRNTIVPLLERIKKSEAPNDLFLKKYYPIEKQREFSDYLMEVMGLDRSFCTIGESEHPFTINFNTKDVRITTHYHEHDLASSLYSVVHEGGHALYELGGSAEYEFTFLYGGVSMGIHESQSRFYENIIGRSLAFIELIFPKLKQLFPEQLDGVTAEMFWKAVNKAETSLIRTEADDLSYCLHVMVRYEIEKELIGGILSVRDVPRRWNALYKEYLGVDVTDDTRGCLQDSHWSGGSIGYFPSYALGSAYGPQLLHVMQQELGDIDVLVREGKLSVITQWLREKIHQHSSYYEPDELFEKVCGKFDAKYYINYLTDKYTKLYGL